MQRRHFHAAALALLAPGLRAQPAFPNQPITVVVPYAAGGIVDVLTRLVLDPMSQALQQRLIVDNRTGADGRIGIEKVLKSPADGYTLLAASPLLAVGESLGPEFSFKAKDFVGIGAIASPPALCVVPASSPWRTLNDVVEAAKARPGQLNVPHPGRGSSIHLAQELFFQEAGIAVNSIPYKGQAPAVIDLAAGNLHFAMIHQSVALPHVQSGKLRAIAANAGHRTGAQPAVPTVAEAGYPQVLVQAWSGLVAPAGTPAAVVDVLAAAMRKAMATPALRERLKAMDVDILDHGSSQFTALIAREAERFGRLIRERKLAA